MLLKPPAVASSFCGILFMLHHIGIALSTSTSKPNPRTLEPTQTLERNITKGNYPVSHLSKKANLLTSKPSTSARKAQLSVVNVAADRLEDGVDSDQQTFLPPDMSTLEEEATDTLKTVGDVTETPGASYTSFMMRKTPISGSRREPVSTASIVETIPQKSGSINVTKLVTSITTSHLPISSSSSSSSQSSSSSSSSLSPSQPAASTTSSSPLLVESSQSSKSSSSSSSSLSSSQSAARQATTSSSPLPVSPSSSPSSSSMSSTTSSSSNTPTGTTTTTMKQTKVTTSKPKAAILRADVFSNAASTPLSKSSASSRAFRSQTDSTSVSALSQALPLEARGSPAARSWGAEGRREGKEVKGAEISPLLPSESSSRDKLQDESPQPLRASYEDSTAATRTQNKSTGQDSGKEETKTPEALGSQHPPGPPAAKGDQPESSDSCPCGSQGSSPTLRYQAAVSAVLTNHFGPDKDVIVPFDLELVDLADNYDNESGVFFCSIPGTYVISVHLMSHPGSKVNARIFINSRPVAALWADDNKNGGFYPSSSIQTISPLEFGDQVYVMLVDGGYGDSWVHANYNVFTVFLLYEDFLGR